MAYPESRFTAGRVWRIALALALIVTSLASRADWLAMQPGTQVSVQVQNNGFIVVRPLGGVWTHPVCSDVTAAVLVEAQFGQLIVRADVRETLYQILVTAAANGATVNLFADPTRCHAQGFPLIRSVRIEP